MFDPQMLYCRQSRTVTQGGPVSLSFSPGAGTISALRAL